MKTKKKATRELVKDLLDDVGLLLTWKKAPTNTTWAGIQKKPVGDVKESDRIAARRNELLELLAVEEAEAMTEEGEAAAQVRRTTAATMERLIRRPAILGITLKSGNEVVDAVGESILQTIRLQGLGGKRAAAILSGIVEFALRAPRISSTGLELQRMILRLNAAAGQGV